MTLRFPSQFTAPLSILMMLSRTIRAISCSHLRPRLPRSQTNRCLATPTSVSDDHQVSEIMRSIGLQPMPEQDLISTDPNDPDIFVSDQEIESDSQIRFRDYPFVKMAVTDAAFANVPDALKLSVANILSKIAPKRRSLPLKQTWTEVVNKKFLNPCAIYDRDRSIEYLQNDHFMSHAVLRRIFREIKKRRPNLSVSRVLDFGAGTGSAQWALGEEFNTSLQTISCVEPAPFMRDLGQQQSQHVKSVLSECNIDWYTTLPDPSPHSITIASFVMTEVHEANRAIVLDHLWSCTEPGGVLVLVDFANAECNSVLHQCRKYLLNYNNAKVLAPCPHSSACPWQDRFGVLLETKDKRKLRRRQHERNFCHFAQRVKLDSFPAGSVMKMRPKTGSKLRFQHEHMVPFVYSVIEKNDAGNTETGVDIEGVDQWSRMIRPPIKRGGHVIVEVCQSDGKIERQVVSRRKGAGGPYKLARVSSWSDLWPYTRVVEDEDQQPDDEH